MRGGGATKTTTIAEGRVAQYAEQIKEVVEQGVVLGYFFDCSIGSRYGFFC